MLHSFTGRISLLTPKRQCPSTEEMKSTNANWEDQLLMLLFMQVSFVNTPLLFAAHRYARHIAIQVVQNELCTTKLTALLSNSLSI